MTTHVLTAELPRPEALGHAAWAAIQDPFQRLRSAVTANDRPLIVGSAKDLIEATARVVLDARGRPAGSGEEYDKVLGDAHRAIEHQVGPGVAADAAVRQAATAARKLAGVLRELRNTYGTGHGRSVLPVLEDEVLETCVDAALLWTRWALRRLQLVLLGSLQPLIADLGTASFSMGSLATRLAAADLPQLEPADQRQLGVAVGQRASRNTFTVRIDGVEACALSQDAVTWPLGYREGVVEGLFLDQFGQVHVDEQARAPRLAAEILAPHSERTRILTELAERIYRSAWSQEFRLIWRQAVAEMHLARRLLGDATAERAWTEIAEHIQQTGEAYDALQQ
ncbi:abortive infection family protein [Micromonospora sp. WMMD1155]|uniref:abortive infection family protein n=1 Tax=Micromonospora sp. WMMD1155 TaxID=3016094 RepID=UPI00249B59B8|nr:abortive infection family protein [Micromonospora sp. WMMD1155]WFE48858.1 abortive infection family protein [Micromonospora sp. WMMD1155]